MRCVKSAFVGGLLLLCACNATRELGPRPAGQSLAAMPEARFFAALELMNNGDWSGAETAFLDLADRYPAYSGPWTNLGIIAAGHGQTDRAIQYFQRAIAANPANAVAMTNLAALLHRSGDDGAALALYQRVLGGRPDYPDVHLNLALLYEKALGRKDDALRHYRRYQQLTQEENLAVAAWILELEQGGEASDYRVVSK